MYELCCCNAGRRSGRGVDRVVEPLRVRESEITLFADGVVGLVGGFMVIDVLIGGNGTFDSLASDMADEVDIIRVRDLDLGRAIPDLKEVGAEDVGVFERNELTLPTEFAPDSLPPLLPRCPFTWHQKSRCLLSC